MTQQKTNLKTVQQILSIFNECYPGKLNKTDLTEKIWLRMLRDLDAEPVLAAAYQVCTSRPNWPPDIATVRQTAVGFAHGEMTAPTGQEAWANILKRFTYEEYPLTNEEKEALKQVGTIYDLKKSTNPAADRAHFIRAFDHLIHKRSIERSTLPEIKLLVEHNIPLLAEPESPARRELPPGGQTVTYPADPQEPDPNAEQVPRQDIADYAAKLSEMIDLKESSAREQRQDEAKEALDRR